MTKLQRQRLHVALSVVVTLIVAFFALLPLYWILLTSFKAPGTEFRLPIRYWPAEISLEPYRTILGPDFQVQRAIRNSLVVSTVTTIGALLVASLAAYAIARLRFHYKWRSLLFVQVASMLPPIIVIAPTFLIIRGMGLLGGLPGLIIPNIVYSIPLSTWLIASYFAGLPFELEDAAKVDGSPPLRIYWQIMLPLAAPGALRSGGDCVPWLVGRVHARLHDQHGLARSANHPRGRAGLHHGHAAPMDLGVGRHRTLPGAHNSAGDVLPEAGGPGPDPRIGEVLGPPCRHPEVSE